MFTHKQTHRADKSIVKRPSYHAKAVIGAILLSMVAGAFYQVRELIAALLIFSVLFGTVGMAFLTLFLIQELAVKGLVRIETSTARIRGRHIVTSGQPHPNPMARSSR